jgi:hypothetical protein
MSVLKTKTIVISLPPQMVDELDRGESASIAFAPKSCETHFADTSP